MVTDDPREILKAAGVECAEVERMYRDWLAFGKRDVPWSAFDAILALARLFADLNAQRCEGCGHVRHHAVGKPHAYRLCSLGNSFGYDAALPDDFACNRWKEHRADSDA